MLPSTNYGTVALQHLAGDSSFSQWNSTLDNVNIRQLVQSVQIHSTPEGRGEPGFEYQDTPTYLTWKRWEEEGTWPEFTDSIGRIKDLPALTTVNISFCDRCIGRRDDDKWIQDWAEPIDTRINTLKAVFEAIQQRAGQQPDEANEDIWRPVSTLVLENLQNLPIPEFTDSDLFRDVTKHITNLKLSVVQEWQEHGPDRDLWRVERQTFEPHLIQHWLAPMAEQLTDLALQFDEPWGTAPAYSNLEKLTFPNLKTLHLGNFAISHHNHLDWVLAQKSLTTLILDDCSIATHLAFREADLAEWKVHTHDWKRHPENSYGIYGEDAAIFTFDGTWEFILDRIRRELPLLTDFRFDNPDDWISPEDDTFSHPETIGCGLSNKRYIAFDTGMLPSPWLDADGWNGMMEFGVPPDDLDELDPEYAGDYDEDGLINMAKKYSVGDTRAFEELVQTVEKRRSEGSQ